MAKKPSVLIIEDDSDQVLMYEVEFELHGFEVHTAEEAEKGIQKAKEIQPDAILLDINMEGKNGLEVMEELNADEKTKNIPVLVFTNFGREKFESKARVLGARKFIPKTQMVPRQIVSEVSKVIGVETSKKKVKRHKENILLIEDSPFHRQMYATKFGRSGYMLIIASNGEDGLKKVQENKIDLILLDLALPGISGVEVLKQLKETEKTKDIPVVAFTVTPKADLPPEAKKVIEKHTIEYFEKMTQLPSEAVELVKEIFGE